METAEIRRRWLRFFEERGHTVVPSASLISDDPTLLFTVAGMVPFMPYFTGAADAAVAARDERAEVRAHPRHRGGRQDHPARHVLPDERQLLLRRLLQGRGDQLRLGAGHRLARTDGGSASTPRRSGSTVFETDDEADELWRAVAGLPEERIQRRGMVDNYWSTGQPGPGGPCSEIYVDRGPEYGRDGGPIVDEDRYLEIWNLVFMQDERGAGCGRRTTSTILGHCRSKNIDTGMGLERMAYLLQGVDNLYEIDEVYPVLDRAAEMAGKRYAGSQGPRTAPTTTTTCGCGWSPTTCAAR